MSANEILREELAVGTRILGRHDMIGLFGHVSLLTEDPQRYLICPGAGTRKDRCRASDIIELDLDHEFEPGLPLELYMHSEVHRLKPEIKSLIHVHSPALLALSSLAEVPGTLLMLHASFWPKVVPVFDDPGLVRNREIAQKLIHVLGDESIALLRWHGAIIVGHTLREAVLRAVMAEQHAQQLLTALSHGAPLAAVDSDIDREQLYSEMLPPFTHNMNWWYERSYVHECGGAQVDRS
jgi:ribulose-5-phosphate 4-epimerase/fuculose-1-phosphate aldolase